MVCGLENLATLLDTVAIQANNEGFSSALANHLECLDDSIGDRVASGNATKDVYEDALDLRVTQNYIEPSGHDLGGCSATDIEEVGGLHTPVLLSGVGDDVEGGMKMGFQAQMGREEAVALVCRSLWEAAEADSATGGPDMVRGIFPIIAAIDADGWDRIDDSELATVFTGIIDTARGSSS